MWSVRLFGGFAGERNRELLDAPPASTHALLAALLTGPRRVQRVPLARELYPDVDEATARQRVSHQLWLVRQRWADVPIEVGRDQITVDVDAWSVDVVEFRHCARAEDAETGLRALHLASRGPVLPDNDNPFAVSLREEIQLEAAQLRLRLSRRMLDIGELDLSVQLAQESVAGDPLDERRVLHLLRALIASGRRADAKAEFTRYALGVEQLGVPLGPEIATILESGPEVVAIGGPAEVFHEADAATTIRRALRAGQVDDARPLVRALVPDHADRAELEGLLALAEGHHDLALDRFAASTSGVGVVRQAEALIDGGDVDAAEDRARAALLAVDTAHAATIRAGALVVLSRCALERGAPAEAGAFADRAVQEARRVPGRYELARARLAAGQALLAAGHLRPAMADLRRAWTIGDEEDYRFVTLDAALALGSAAARTGALRRAAVAFTAAASAAATLGRCGPAVVAGSRRVGVLSRLGAHGEAMRSARLLSVDDAVRRDAGCRHRAIEGLLRAATWLGTRPARGTVDKVLASEQVAELDPMRLVDVRAIAALRADDARGALEHLAALEAETDHPLWGLCQALRSLALVRNGDQAGALTAAEAAVLHAGSGRLPLDLAPLAWWSLSRATVDVEESERARRHGAQRIIDALNLNIDDEVDADGFLTRDEVQRDLLPTVKELLVGSANAAGGPSHPTVADPESGNAV